MSTVPTASPEPLPQVPAGFLLFTAVCTGALVMVIEVLGSRVIGPFFGVSLFVWTALITVTLLALALGYALGGQLADRYPSPTPMYLMIGAAGLWVALLPLARMPVLVATLPLGLRAGALAASLLLFGPPLVLLGCVSPYVVRIAVREWGRLGRTVGLFTALSTAGSVAGTLVAGFFLIGHVGVTRTLFLTGALLVALAASYFVLYGRRRSAALAPVLLLALVPRSEFPAVTLPDGTQARVVHSRDSHYGTIRVVDYRHGAAHQREMIIDGLVQGGIDLADGRSVYEYPYLLQWLPVVLHPEGRTCLVVGVGAGIVPAWYERRGVATDVVDIDAEVVAMARSHFGYAPRGEVHIDDARAFFARPGRRYDYVVLDVFNGDTTPAHLLSVEALGALRQRLTARGVLAVNLVGSIDAGATGTAAIVTTLRTLFAQVELHPVFDLAAAGSQGRAGNMVLLAYDGPPRRPASLAFDPPHPRAEPLLRKVLTQRAPLPAAGEAGLVLTDDYNPLDLLDLELKEDVRRRILASTHPAILAQH